MSSSQDRRGVTVQKGDRVMVQARIANVSSNGDCDLELQDSTGRCVTVQNVTSRSLERESNVGAGATPATAGGVS